MAIKQKAWTQMTKGERIGGIIGLCIAVTIGIGLIGGFVSAITSPPPSHHIPTTTYKDVQETETIPFEQTTRDDPTRDTGTHTVTTTGINGIRTKTFHVTYVDGTETDRELIKSEVTKQPVSEVTSIGTRTPYAPPAAPAASSNCNPNYSGCVPIASDVDCAGGSGNGPAYVAGPIQVLGSDIYGLDRDGNGWACE